VALRFLPQDARTAALGTMFDHLGCISVFTDPEAWPMLSDVAYGRIAPVQIDVEMGSSSYNTNFSLCVFKT
jgi:hypothetical protein